MTAKNRFLVTLARALWVGYILLVARALLPLSCHDFEVVGSSRSRTRFAVEVVKFVIEVVGFAGDVVGFAFAAAVLAGVVIWFAVRVEDLETIGVDSRTRRGEGTVLNGGDAWILGRARWTYSSFHHWTNSLFHHRRASCPRVAWPIFHSKSFRGSRLGIKASILSKVMWY